MESEFRILLHVTLSVAKGLARSAFDNFVKSKTSFARFFAPLRMTDGKVIAINKMQAINKF